MKGLIVEIYRNGFGDCSNKGLSSRVTKCLLVGAGVPEIFSSSAYCPPVQIVKRELSHGDYLTAYPVKEDGTLDKGMDGGTFVYSSDSRFRKISVYPVPLHDRFE
jgi:hypothetical protein